MMEKEKKMVSKSGKAKRVFGRLREEVIGRAWLRRAAHVVTYVAVGAMYLVGMCCSFRALSVAIPRPGTGGEISISLLPLSSVLLDLLSLDDGLDPATGLGIVAVGACGVLLLAGGFVLGKKASDAGVGIAQPGSHRKNFPDGDRPVRDLAVGILVVVQQLPLALGTPAVALIAFLSFADVIYCVVAPLFIGFVHGYQWVYHLLFPL